jgi:AP-3 complex subunit beta
MGMFGLQASGAAASWMVGRMGTDAHLYDDPEDAALPALLDSRFDGDKVDALKRLLALIAQGVDVAHLFPQVPLGNSIPLLSLHTPRNGS